MDVNLYMLPAATSYELLNGYRNRLVKTPALQTRVFDDSPHIFTHTPCCYSVIGSRPRPIWYVEARSAHRLQRFQKNKRCITFYLGKRWDREEERVGRRRWKIGGLWLALVQHRVIVVTVLPRRTVPSRGLFPCFFYSLRSKRFRLSRVGQRRPRFCPSFFSPERHLVAVLEFSRRR